MKNQTENYNQNERNAIHFFEKYEFTDGIMSMLYGYIDECRKYKEGKQDDVSALFIFSSLNTQLKQWFVSGAYNEDTYWEGRDLLEEVLYG